MLLKLELYMTKKLKINENKRDNNTLNDCLCIS